MAPIIFLVVLHLASSSSSTSGPLSNRTGLVAVGGYHSGCLSSAEVWLPNSLPCLLPDLPDGMYGNTVSALEEKLVVCYNVTCWQLTDESGWEVLATTKQSRRYHSAASTSHGLLLLGGSDSPETTEILQDNESLQSFALSPGRKNHCSIQVDSSTIVLTGGSRTTSTVTEISNVGNEEVSIGDLPSLITGRRNHACGIYTTAANQQVLLVTGGEDGFFTYLDSTEILSYPEGTGWRQAGALPSPSFGVRAANVDGVLHLTGGWSDAGDSSLVFAWDPVSESWKEVGHLSSVRSEHAVAEVPLQTIASYCDFDLDKL